MNVEQIYHWLEEVKDPEIPVLSLVDLGVITEVTLGESDVRIEMTPTFVGCPALEMMKSEMVNVLRQHGVDKVHIEVTYRNPWTSDRISVKGREALKKFGLAPPPHQPLFSDIEILDSAQCPRCESFDTELRSTFGATLCRAIFYCNHCKEAFEQFKHL